MKLQGYKLNMKSVKKEIKRIYDNTKDKPISAQGIIAFKIASRYFHPIKEPKEYKELYNYTFKLLKQKPLF